MVLRLQILILPYESSEKCAVQAIMGMLGSSVKAWHCAAAELLGRLIINPDNEPFLLPSAPEVSSQLLIWLLISDGGLDFQYLTSPNISVLTTGWDLVNTYCWSTSGWTLKVIYLF